MRPKKLLMLTLRLVIGAGIVLLIWKPLVGIPFWLMQGTDARCDLGGNYEMWGPPPWVIIYWPSIEKKDEYGFERVIDDSVNESALVGPWIIGNTPKGWFAINKESHKVYYPLSKDKLQATTGLDLSSVKMETDPMPYLIVRPQAAAAKYKANLFCWILLFVLPTALAFGPYVIRGLVKKKQASNA
jgi:hypothetical protein